MTRPALKAETTCPHCATRFLPKRSDQLYCQRTCAKAATRNNQRGDRTSENTQRTYRHYETAVELSHKLNRTNPKERAIYILTRLKAATDQRDPTFLNLITDPKLLSATPRSGLGLSKIDRRYFDRRNIAKLANDLCWDALGMSVKSMLKDRPTQDEWDWLIDRAHNLPDRPYCPSAYYIETQDEPLAGELRDLVTPKPMTSEEFFTKLSKLRLAYPLTEVTASNDNHGPRP